MSTTTDELLRSWKASRMAFREGLVMPDGQRFGDVMAPFQREDFESLDSGEHRHAFLERPRGASKTADIAAEAVAELFLGPANGRLFAAGTDRDQAALLHEAAVGWIRRTPLLADAVDIERWKIRVPATDTVLTVLAADAPSTWGLQPTWICCDELAQWPERSGDDLWEALWSSVPKRKARMVCITTPGWDRTSLAWRIREFAQKEPTWYFRSFAGPVPFADPEWIEEQRRTLPPHVFARLFEGKWVEGAGAFLTSSEVNAIP